jgi:hypothetical protein
MFYSPKKKARSLKKSRNRRFNALHVFLTLAYLKTL